MVQGVVIEGGDILSTDPATNELVGRVRATTLEEELETTVQRAAAAQPAWAERPLAERGELLRAACAGLGKRRDELTRTIVREMGKVLSEAQSEVDGAVDKDEFIGHVLEANEPVSVEGGRCLVVRQAHGVVAVCSPWNFPADEILLLAIPAIAAGNTVIVKPSEVAPLTGAIVVEALMAALPPGVASLVQGDGTVGAPLVQHPKVDMVAMTGSSAVGKKIMGACSGTLKRLVLELGGKDPMVVFADADLEKAADAAVTYSLYNCGQVCCSTERVYVEDSVKVSFEERVVEQAKKWTVGNGLDESTKLGPLTSDMQRTNVARQVDDAVANGAKVLYKSAVPEGPGNFYPVTVLTDVRQDMMIQREETFGPVVSIVAFSGSEEDAVALSNDSEYGLSACVYSGDTKKAGRVSRKIRAGQVGVNNCPWMNAGATCPWVGHKGSGFGYHSGPDGWRQFSLPQTLVLEEADGSDGATRL